MRIQTTRGTNEGGESRAKGQLAVVSVCLSPSVSGSFSSFWAIVERASFCLFVCVLVCVSLMVVSLELAGIRVADSRCSSRVGQQRQVNDELQAGEWKRRLIIVVLAPLDPDHSSGMESLLLQHQWTRANEIIICVCA